MESPSLKRFLEPTFYIDFKEESVARLAKELLGSNNDPQRATSNIFRWVRDHIPYSIKDFQLHDPIGFKASTTLKVRRGFCIPKSITVVALLRANEIPARLHFADIINHRSPQRFRDLMGGSNVFVFHAYAEAFLNGRWYKMTPSFEQPLCKKHDYPLCDFDGKGNAIFQPYDNLGRPFVEYIRDRGVTADLPFNEMVRAMVDYYGPKISNGNGDKLGN
ncbi:MAG: transglutaminase family protein [Candidatus Thorarchaeota archaeon]